MQILIKRKVDGPSVPELGTPTSATFDTVIVPLARASTGPSPIISYTIERAQSASGPWTVAATGLGIFGSPPTQYVDGGRTAVTTYFYRAKAADSVGRDSGYCATVSVTTAAIPNARKNWNPGNYVWPDHVMYSKKDAAYNGAIDAVNNVANSNRIAGVQLIVPWARVEPQKNTYEFGFLDSAISRVTQNFTNGKKVIIGVWADVYGQSMPVIPQKDPASATFPDYAFTEGHVTLTTANDLTVKMDSAAAVDRLIALYQAIFTRYGDSPHVEMAYTHETSREWANINVPEQAAQWQRFAVALGQMSSGKKMWACLCINGFRYSENVKNLMDAATESNVGWGVPDIVGWAVKDPVPPGVNFDRYGPTELKYRRNYGLGTNTNINYVNKFNADTRLWTPTAPQQQVVRAGCVSNDYTRFYLNEWHKASHPVWLLRIAAGGASYCASLYKSTTPAPEDFCGSNTLAYLTQPNVAPARTAYPVRP